MEEKIDTELLPVQLTDAEKLAKGADVATAVHKQYQVEEAMKADAKAQRKIIDEHTLEIRLLSEQIRTGQEMRDVPIQWTVNLDKNVVEMVRLDTGEFVKDRPIRPGELQGKLGLGLAN